MKILITGGAGYIGSHTTQALLAAGHEITVLDNLSTGFKESLPNGPELIIGDIKDVDLVANLLVQKKIEAVVHFAAKIVVPESVREPLKYYENNVYGTLCLVKACKLANVKKFVFSSTAAVYGEGMARSILETDLTHPINPYGSSKLMAENILADFRRSQLNQSEYQFNFIVLRYFNVAGASMTSNNGQRSKSATHLIKIACEVIAGKRQGMEIYGTDYSTLDGSCVRDYVHIDDLAQAHVLALDVLNKGHHGGIFNCGYGVGVSVKEVIRTMEKVSNKKIDIQISSRRPGDSPYLVANSEKIQKELNWRPKYNSIETICRSALEWELNAHQY
jgi:UDP-glucose 4-epimerase